jgi:hypothetical protein
VRAGGRARTLPLHDVAPGFFVSVPLCATPYCAAKSGPAAQLFSPGALLWSPPLTEESAPLAVFLSPPLTDEKLPLAVLFSPPLTEALKPLAVFRKPPLTELGKDCRYRWLCFRFRR